MGPTQTERASEEFVVLWPAWSAAVKPPLRLAQFPTGVGLPRMPRRVAGTSSGQPSKQTDRGSILIVEDDPQVRATVVEVLQFEGYKVVQASNGAEALELLHQMRPMLILLDMRMPVVNGWQFANSLRERGITVPLVVMTAARDARRWAEEIGARGYVTKPFVIDELLAAVEFYKE